MRLSVPTLTRTQAQAHYDDEAVAADDGPAALDDGALLAPPELEQVSVRDGSSFARLAGPA